MSPQRLRSLDASESGRGLLRPLPLAAIALLLLNDHVLKAASPGVLTGKLSDLAGLAFFPLLLVAAAELGALVTGRPIRHPDRILTWAIVATGLAFTIIKVLPIATAAWAAMLGTAQWPFAAILAAASQGPIPTMREVEAVADPTDLVALPALLLAWFDGRRRLLSPSRRRPGASTARRPGIVPVSALIVAGLASLATSPPRGIPTDIELAIETDLTGDHPVAIRTFDVTVDASAVEGSISTHVTANGHEEGVRHVLTTGDQQDRSDRPQRVPPSATVQLGPCQAQPCTRTVNLITELIDPATAPATATTTLTVRATPGTPDEELGADAITIVERGGPRSQAAPSVVRGELSGEDTLGPANPIVEHHIAVHREPGEVLDPARFLLGGRLYLEAPMGSASVALNMGAPRLDQASAESSLEHPIEVELPTANDCSDTEACDVEYVIRLKAGAAMVDPSVVRWRIALEMRDYALEGAPAARVITADLTETIGMDPSGVTIRQTVRGRYQVTEDRNPPEVGYFFDLDDSTTTLPNGKLRPLFVTHRMTVSGVEATGPQTHESPPLQLKFGAAPYTIGTFQADGRAHTFYRYDQCGGCEGDYDFDVRVKRAEVATPVWLDWTLEIEVRAWGGVALPPGGHLEIQTLQPERSGG